MLIVICASAAAAIAVVAYGHLKNQSTEAGTARLRAVRELAAVVLVLVKAVEAVADVLGHERVQAPPAIKGWGYRSYDEYDEDEQP